MATRSLADRAISGFNSARFALTEPVLLMALGWLAREGQVTLLRVRNSLQVSRKGGN